MGLQGCCGCMSLKEGSKAIGITYLVLSALSALSYTWKFVKYAQEAQEPMPAYVYVLCYAQLLLYIVFNSLLIQGVNSSSRGMVLAWLIFHGIIHGIQSLAIVALIILGIVYNVPLLYLAAAIVAGLVGLFWYWYVVVLTHYNEMRSNDGFVYQQHAMEKQ